MEDRKINITFDDSAIDFLSEKGYDPLFGARPIKRAIQNYVENPLAKAILEGKVVENSNVITTCVTELSGEKVLVFA